MLKTPKHRASLEIFAPPPYRRGMITIASALLSVLSFRFRSRASLELELIALRHQLAVLRRQRPGRLRIFATDRLLDVALPDLAADLERHGAGEAGDCDPTASQGFPAVLAVAMITLRGPAQGELRDP
jgi:hypothetical protein